MSEKRKSGGASRTKLYDVEAGMIRRFAEAVGDRNPLHNDLEYARNAGFQGLVAPPTFPVTFTADLSELVGFNVNDSGVLLGEQTFEYERSIISGDRITVVRSVDDTSEVEGGVHSMKFVRIYEEGADALGNIVYRGRRTLIVRRT